MNRGSEWNKWDLHIHTPETSKNDQFGNADVAWPEFINRLENTDILVFGITDYFSIENYLKVKEYQESGRLKGKYIIPNIEMRISPVTGKGTPINIHVLFDPSLSEEELNREFFRKIIFKYKEADYSCIKEDLISLGRIIKGENDYPEKAAIKEAIGIMTISYENLRDIVGKPFFRNKIIVAVSNSSHDGLSGLLRQGDALLATKREIFRMVDIVLSGNPNDIDYFLGKKTSKDEVIENCGSLKPCITGSDAHSLDRIGLFHNDRITWIKAEPTFEGLKQILFEPDERVKISEIRPDSKYDYNIIDRIELNYAGIWHQTILLNQNLNTIIGGRSTGKSTLLASIAIKFDDQVEIENRDFINQLSDGVHVIWKDGQENNTKSIEYFPQNYISNIADKQYTDKLLLQILMDNPEKKQKYDEYKSSLATRFVQIQSKVSLFFEKRRLLQEKQLDVKKRGDLEGIKREIIKLQTARTEIQKTLTDKQPILKAFEDTEKDLIKLKDTQLKYRNEINSLDIIRKQFPFLINNTISLSELSSENKDMVNRIINEAIVQANSYVHKGIEAIVQSIKVELQKNTEEIKRIENSDAYKQGKQIFEVHKNLYQIIKEIEHLKNKEALITKELSVIESMRKECIEIGQELIEIHTNYLDLMNDIASNMRMQHEDVRLSSEIVLKDSFEKMLAECISLRSSIMNERIEKVINEYKSHTKSIVKNCSFNLLCSALKNELSYKGGFDSQSFISKFLSECWYELRLSVEYDGDNLRDMSPGKRSFVVLKLLLDFSDKKCPILIDQPEDNLDNRAIYNELVKYLKRKKKDRQIILVTHNPNIVVGADSEEVIVSNQNGKNAPNVDDIKFQYKTGSLENSMLRVDDSEIPLLSRCGIREHVCDILEGGERAFRDRENKYGFNKV